MIARAALCRVKLLLLQPQPHRQNPTSLAVMPHPAPYLRTPPCIRSSSSCSTGSPTARTTHSAGALRTRSPRRRTSTGSQRRARVAHVQPRPRARARERAGALGDARLHARGVPRPRRARGDRRRAGDRPRASSSPSPHCVRPSGATTASGSRVGRADGEDEEDSAELVTACDGLEIDGLRFELEHLQRGEAILRVFPGADDRVTDSDAFFKEWYPVLTAAGAGSGGREHGTCRRDVDAADDRAARGTSRQRAPRVRRAPAAERDHAQVVGAAGDRTRASASATACTAASSATRSSCSAWRARSASSRATSPRPMTRLRTCAPAWSWRSNASTRATLSSSRTSRRRPGRPHEGSADQEEHDRGARRRARRPADRPRDRLRHRRPRDADVSGRDPLRRPRAVHRQRPGRPRRRGRGVRRARLRTRDPRPPARAGHDARAPERRRPPALPRLCDRPCSQAPDGYPGPPRAALDGDRSPHPQLRDLARCASLHVAWTNLFLLWLIVGTGAAVRLTDSGLGCSHWPGCERGAPLPEKNVHAFVEFGNRLVGGVVITVTLLTWLAARKTPGLPDWARKLALAVLLGALAQAPLGYLAVASDLRWPVVMAHLLLSMALHRGCGRDRGRGGRTARRARRADRPARAPPPGAALHRGGLRAHRQRHVRDRRRPALPAEARHIDRFARSSRPSTCTASSSASSCLVPARDRLSGRVQRAFAEAVSGSRSSRSGS